MIAFGLDALAVQMLVELGIENALGKRLLQLVNQAILVENVLRITAGQKLVQ